MQTRRPLTTHHSPLTHPRQGGAVLIVVISLMATLAFLGFFFYSFSDQALQTAESFRLQPDAEIDPDPIINDALQQILVSTPANRQESALYGNRWSILAHVIGALKIAGEDTNGNGMIDPGEDVNGNGVLDPEGIPLDIEPYSGRGIVLRYLDANSDGIPDNPSQFAVDYDGNPTTPNPNQNDFRLNFSADANGGMPFAFPAGFNFHPDAGYTYPDLNSFFLSYDGGTFVEDDFNQDGIVNTGEDLNRDNQHETARIYIPSFFRPQLFPAKRTGGFGDLYADPATAKQVLHPHAYHIYGTLPSGEIVTRYLINEDPNGNNMVDPGEPGDFNNNGRLESAYAAGSGDRTRLIEPFFNNLNGAGPMGIFSGIGQPIRLDVDADGDGEYDSIWLDLDYPLIDLPDGRQAVPLFYTKIVDADALLNVNLDGNLNHITALSSPFGNNAPASASNTGLSRTEVNLGAAFYARPDNPEDLDPAAIAAVMRDYGAFYGFAPTTYYDGTLAPEKRLTTANMELGFLLLGRLRSSGLPGMLGRWGEGNLFPTSQPGTTGQDDDLDSNASIGMAGARPYGGYPYQDPTTPGGEDLNRNGRLDPGEDANGNGMLDNGVGIPPFIHPLDYRGVGGYLATGAPVGARRGLATPPPVMGSPATWPKYDANWQEQGTAGEDQDFDFVLDPGEDRDNDGMLDPPVYGLATYRSAVFGQLQPDAADQLTDEGDEVTIDSSFASVNDAPFGPDELAALHLSDNHWNLVRADSRLRALMSFSLQDNRSAAAIRSQLTTDSRDRAEFSYQPPAVGVRMTSEFTPWNGTTSGYMSPLAFPPQFGPARAGGQNDPFRPELRRLLKTEPGNVTNISAGRAAPRHRLNINRLLADDSLLAGGPPAFDRNGNPLYRHLTPHPVFAGGAPTNVPPVIHANPDPNNPPAPPPFQYSAIRSNPIAQEWWARYDRQRLARDIYVLLYTLAAPDSLDIVTNAYTEDIEDFNGDGTFDGNNIPDRVEEFAQFAVNYVDALDRDHVITRFEYDSNLSDGWNMPNRSVDGIEAQQLTFSEVLWVKSPSLGSGNDNADTFWNDEDHEHHFLYIELRNASPFSVPLNDDSWRIVRQPSGMGTGPTGGAVAGFEVRNAARDIGAGQNFVIAMNDKSADMQVPQGTEAGNTRSGDLYVNYDPTPNGAGVDPFEVIVPWRRPDGNADLPVDSMQDNPPPLADLDLTFTSTVSADHQNHFRYSPSQFGTGSLVEQDDATLQFDLVLQRRRHLNTLGSITQTADDWVEVDRITVTPTTFTPSGTLQTELGKLRSTERAQPFDPGVDLHADTAPRSHTIGDPVLPPNPAIESTDPNEHKANSNGGPFTLWQPHFDRDYSSIYELLSIPLFGTVTEQSLTTLAMNMQWLRRKHGGATANLAQAGTPPRLSGHTAASVRIFRPGGADLNADMVNELVNRWYRLFEFIDVGTRVNETIRDRLSLVRRDQALINLNMLRHPHNLAALIDDPTHINPSVVRTHPTLDRVDNSGVTMPDPVTGEVNAVAPFGDFDRDWFVQLALARDGRDLGFTNFPIPGLVGSRPFRGMSYVDPIEPDLSLNDTILRGHYADPLMMPTPPPTLRNLQLFEARSLADVGNDFVDFHTRNRLLCKIANNTTNRSHVFMIWLGYELFEAHQPDPQNNPNVVQIGARIQDIPGHREFVVVDMTRLEEAYVDRDPTDTIPGTFDFRKFIIYRKRIQ